MSKKNIFGDIEEGDEESDKGEENLNQLFDFLCKYLWVNLYPIDM